MKFTEVADKVLEVANQQAHEWNHDYIGTEHLLMAFIDKQCENGFGRRVLNNLKVDIKQIRIEIEYVVSKGPSLNKIKSLPMTPRASKVIEYANDFAESMKQEYVGSHHILLGLMENIDNIAAQILIARGVTKEKIKAEIRQLLGTEPNKIKTCTNCVCFKICSIFLLPNFPNKKNMETMFGKDGSLQLIEEIKQLVGQRCENFEEKL